MKRILLAIVIAVVAALSGESDAFAQVSSRYGWSAPRTTSRTSFRALQKHKGLIFRAGVEDVCAKDMDGLGITMQGGVRFPMRTVVGGGIMPSVHMTRFHKYLETNVYHGKVIGNEECPRMADFNWTYFAMPIYAFGSFDFLPGKLSPMADVRLGYQVKAEFGGAPYFHVDAGCRISMARTNIHPYVGYTYNDSVDDFKKSVFSVGISFWFTNKYKKK